MQGTTKRDEMFALIEEWKNSGKTQKQFSREQGIKYSKFLYWKKKYQKSTSGWNNGFLPLEVVTSGENDHTIDKTNQPRVEVEFSSGITFRIY